MHIVQDADALERDALKLDEDAKRLAEGGYPVRAEDARKSARALRSRANAMRRTTRTNGVRFG